MQKESSEKIYINSGNEDIIKLVTRPNCRILDVGCGSGSLAQILLKMGHQIDGITIFAKEYEVAQKFLQRGYMHNLETGLPQNILHSQYDYVICSHVLEHICYPNHLLNDIKVCLKDDSMLIVALPNIFHYASRWKLLCGKFDYKESGIWDNTHFKWYSFKSGSKLLEQHGFKVTMKKVTGNLPGYSILSKILSKPIESALFNVLTAISPGLFGYQLIYVAELKDSLNAV